MKQPHAFSLLLAMMFLAFACSPEKRTDPSEPGAATTALATCPYEANCDCASPGIPLRWRAAYCMAKSETDDAQADAVQGCLAKPEPASIVMAAPCKKNRYWRERRCRFNHKDAGAQYKHCMTSPDAIPSVLKDGI